MPRLYVSSSLCFLLCASVTFAGPDVIEGLVDAGQLTGTAFDTTSLFVGQPTSISGRLGGNEDPGLDNDYVDAFFITITSPGTFAAMTFPPGSSLTNRAVVASDFDTQLWLFDASGIGLLANDDKAVADTSSLIMQPSTDGTAVIIPGPGTYILAISIKGVFPESAGGAIFDFFGDPTEISGPDGIGGASALTTWDESSPSVTVPGDYFIMIVPSPSTPVAIAICMFTARRRRARA